MLCHVAKLSALKQSWVFAHLGIGGDNSDGAVGTFFEGAMTAGFSTEAADDAVQANIISAGYTPGTGR